MRIISTKTKLVRTVVFNVSNVCYTDEAGVFHGVNPEQDVDKRAVHAGHGSRQTAHVVMIINESNGKPRSRVQRDTHTPYVSLRCDACNCTYRRNSVLYLQQNSIT